MERKGIPKKRIGPEEGCWERSIRMRQFKVIWRALNAAERSAYRSISTSLCGIKGKKREIKKEKEVVKGNRQSYYLAGRSRERFAPFSESAGVKPFVKRPAQ